MSRRAEAASSAEIGDSFPPLAMRKYPLRLGACGDHALGAGSLGRVSLLSGSVL